MQWITGAESVFDCTSLEQLYLDEAELTDATPFASLAGLRSLSVGNAPIASLKGIDALTGLKYLALYRLRQLESLAGLERLTRLTHFEMMSCT